MKYRNRVWAGMRRTDLALVGRSWEVSRALIENGSVLGRERQLRFAAEQEPRMSNKM